MRKTKCAIIGSGNISTDLLYKLKRSEVLEPVWMVGIDPTSEGLKRAAALGLKTTSDGIAGLVAHVAEDRIEIVFDATSAKAHVENWNALKDLGVRMIDLTPAAIGKLCVPTVNLEALDLEEARNVNMISCGGQATTPIVHAIGQVHAIRYAEIVASMSSKSVGPGSRQNLDEVLQTTGGALVQVAGAKESKVLVVVNPAEPPMLMRNTVSCLIDEPINGAAVSQAIADIAAQVRNYVPGYRVVHEPVIEGQKITVFLEVEGEGDFLPKYAGNLDIMTAAARRTGEMIAKRMMG